MEYVIQRRLLRTPPSEHASILKSPPPNRFEGQIMKFKITAGLKRDLRVRKEIKLNGDHLRYKIPYRALNYYAAKKHNNPGCRQPHDKYNLEKLVNAIPTMSQTTSDIYLDFYNRQKVVKSHNKPFNVKMTEECAMQRAMEWITCNLMATQKYICWNPKLEEEKQMKKEEEKKKEEELLNSGVEVIFVSDTSEEQASDDKDNSQQQSPKQKTKEDIMAEKELALKAKKEKALARLLRKAANTPLPPSRKKQKRLREEAAARKKELKEKTKSKEAEQALNEETREADDQLPKSIRQAYKESKSAKDRTKKKKGLASEEAGEAVSESEDVTESTDEEF